MYAEMAETAYFMDRHQIARLRAAVPKGVVGGNAGAEERRRLAESSASGTCASAEASASMWVA